MRAEIDSDADADAIRAVCSEAAKAVTLPNLPPEAQEAVIALWLAWADFEDSQDPTAWKGLLRDSLLTAGVPDLHPSLLAAYFAAELRRGAEAGATLEAIVAGYHPTPAFFAPAFDALIDAEDEQEAQKSGKAMAKGKGKKEEPTAHLYRLWRTACRLDSDRVDAALSYARHLLEEGRGRDAHVAVETARREVEGEAAVELDEGWTRLVDEAERARMGEDEDEEMDSGSEDESEEEGSGSEEDGEAQGEDEEMDEEDEEGSDGSGDLEMTL